MLTTKTKTKTTIAEVFYDVFEKKKTKKEKNIEKNGPSSKVCESGTQTFEIITLVLGTDTGDWQPF